MTTPHLPITAASLLDRLLGLDRLSWSQPNARLDWQTPLPAWVWVGIALAAAALAVWSYGRMYGARRSRMSLAAVRALLMIVVAALIAGPILTLVRERIDPDCLVMLVDRSASMRTRDTPSATSTGSSAEPIQSAATNAAALLTRDDALRRALAAQADVFGPDRLGHHREILWLGFDSEAYPIDPPIPAPPAAVASVTPTPTAGALPAPDGRATAIRTAIEQAILKAAGRPISGIVLMTDGRTPQNTSTGFTQQLEQRAIAVYPVPLGAAVATLDLRLARVSAPTRAFVNDAIPVQAWIDTYPPDAAPDPARVHIRLTDDQTGEVLDQRTLADQPPGQPIRLLGESRSTGETTWRVRVSYEPDTPLPDAPRSDMPDAEPITENNTRTIPIEMIRRPLRVLYVEGYPRWEYRYLKNVLIREKSIESSMMLISADRAFAQEGDMPISRLPATADEMQPYDVIVIGDVPADYFSATQRALIRDQVAQHGAGLLWIAGPNDTPRGYDATTLADLLPMRRPADVVRLGATDEPVAIQPTPLARALNILRLDSRTDTPDPAAPALASRLPGFWWAQDLGRLKPSAEVLATAGDAGPTAAPLLTRIRYGAGQSLYLATDETWRWRFGTGDLYFERFWLQLIRALARNRADHDPQRAVLSTSHSRIELGQTLVAQLRISDAQLLERDLPSISVEAAVVIPDAAQSTATIERIELLPQSASAGRTASPSASGSGSRRVYRAAWRPTTPGHLRLHVAEPALQDIDITHHIEVIHPNDELRQPLPDHDRLRALAEQTGGQIVPLGQLDELIKLVPNRARRTPNDIREPLWDSPLALIVVVLLLTIEWIGRKVLRLA